MKVFHDDNNEKRSRGVSPQADGTFLALTLTASKEFRTRRGAEAWLKRRGIGPDGERLA